MGAMTRIASIGRAVAGVALVVVLGACGFKSPPGSVKPTIEERRVPLGEPFELEPNERVGVEGSDLRLSFLTVEGDSRCPSDAQCPHAGDAIVQLAVSSLDVQTTVGLHVAGPRSREVDGYLLELVELSPEPASGEDIEHDDYELTLRVTPAGGTQ